MNRLLENMPNLAPDGPLNRDSKGLLSPIGDPIGQVLAKGLSPIGHVTGAIGNPSGQALLDVQADVKEKVGYSKDEEKPEEERPGGERIGGNQQTGQNPLGL